MFVSPDVGNVKRAQVYANMIGGEICIIDKRRKSGKDTVAKNIIGEVEGKNVLMIDDMITTAGTITEAVRIVRENGAKDVYIAATHAVGLVAFLGDDVAEPIDESVDVLTDTLHQHIDVG